MSNSTQKCTNIPFKCENQRLHKIHATSNSSVCVPIREREKVKYLYIQSREGGGKVTLEQYLIGNIVLYNVLIIRKGFVFQHITEVSQKNVTTHL